MNMKLSQCMHGAGAEVALHSFLASAAGSQLQGPAAERTLEPNEQVWAPGPVGTCSEKKNSTVSITQEPSTWGGLLAGGQQSSYGLRLTV